MQKFQIARTDALSKIRAADHMLTQTYPKLGDNKILIAVLSNIIAGVEQTMTAILHYDRIFHKIPPFHDTFQSKLHLFKNTSASIHKITEFVPFLNNIHLFDEKHKRSPMEFPKKDSYIICDDDYKISKITAKDLKKLIDESKSFYMKAAEITSKNEGIFNPEEKD